MTTPQALPQKGETEMGFPGAEKEREAGLLAGVWRRSGGAGQTEGGGKRIDTDLPTLSSASLTSFRNPSFLPVTFMGIEADDLCERGRQAERVSSSPHPREDSSGLRHPGSQARFCCETSSESLPCLSLSFPISNMGS